MHSPLESFEAAVSRLSTVYELRFVEGMDDADGLKLWGGKRRRDQTLTYLGVLQERNGRLTSITRR